jgi:hypothetical protein
MTADPDRQILRVVFEYLGSDGHWVEMFTLWLPDPQAVLWKVDRAVSSRDFAKITWRVRIRSAVTY